MTNILKEKELSVVIPCLNEEKTVGICIEKCLKVFRENNINGEVIVVDNGSTDNSRGIILNSGAILIEEPRKGYGSAYLKGFSNAKGKYFVMGDADNTYDFLEIPSFLKPLKEGYDFVIGTRLKGRIVEGEGSMPWLHKYIGNPMLTLIIKMIFRVKVSDVYCGMRAMTRESYDKLKIGSTGMEFALEMIVNASRIKLKVKEIPISLGLRDGESKLNTFKDGWRSLRFILMYSPSFLFIFPAALFFITGTILMLLQLGGPFIWNNVYMGIHTMLLGLTLSIFGIYIFQMGVIIKSFSVLKNYYNKDNALKWLEKLTVEKGLIFGCLLIIVGLVIDLDVIARWAENGFKDIYIPQYVVFGFYFMLLGLSAIFFSFLNAIMKK